MRAKVWYAIKKKSCRITTAALLVDTGAGGSYYFTRNILEAFIKPEK